MYGSHDLWGFPVQFGGVGREWSLSPYFDDPQFSYHHDPSSTNDGAEKLGEIFAPKATQEIQPLPPKPTSRDCCEAGMQLWEDESIDKRDL